MATSSATTTRGGLYGGNLVDFIIGRSKALHLDPAAVLSVASVEGGFNGAVGDKGTSFGPFQLHEGGRLPAGLSGAQAQAFANSPAGVDYALRGIAGVASGQTGTSAVSSIVTRFEQPANPSAEVSSASSRYDYMNAAVHGPATAGLSGSGLLNLFKNELKIDPQLAPLLHSNNPFTSIPTGVSGAGTTFASFFGINLPKHWLQRGAEMFAGGVLILLGLIIIVIGGRGTPASQTTRAVRTVTR